MTHIVTSRDALTPGWFNAVFNEVELVDEAVVVDASIEPIGTGQLSRMVLARLTYDQPTRAPDTVVVKYPSDDQSSLGFAQALGMYELEVRFYREIVPRLGDLSVADCHLAEVDADSGTFTLVLEDLSERCKPGDVLTEGTPEECSVALAELVNMQAPLWDSSRLEELAWLTDRSRTTRLFTGLSAGLEPFLERFGSALDPEHVKLLETVMPHAAAWPDQWKEPIVLQHGDFRADNLMYGAVPGAPAATIIDFQLIRLGPSGFDPAYFIGSSLSTETRRKIERDLMREYHERLVGAGVSEFDFDQCWAAYREGALYGVMMFCGAASQVEATERGDRMVLDQISRYADMALDLDALAVADLGPQAASL